MNPLARVYMREAFRRFSMAPPPKTTGMVARVQRFMVNLFALQLAVVDAVLERGERRVGTFCTRRAGKTTLFGFLLLYTSLRFPGTLCTYYAITRIRAKQLIWDELKRISRDYALGFSFNETELEARSPEGSIIRLTGADKLSEAQKKLGDKNKLAIVDEAQLYPQAVLFILVDRVLEPTLLDLQGSLILGGTPGLVCQGLWYEITRNEDADSESRRAPGWKIFEWSLLVNPFLPHAREEVARIASSRGWGPTHPTLLREYGDASGRPRWVNDKNALFYRYDESRHAYDGELPSGHAWRYVIGIDLGTDDAFAFVVWAFAPTSPNIYEVEDFSASGLYPAQWAEHLKDARERYGPVSMRADTGGLGKGIVMEMQARHELPIEAAEKTSKAAFVSLLNSDLDVGCIKVLRDGELAREWKVLPKNPEKPLEEAPTFPNHASDAGLYGWRDALHFLGRTPVESAPVGSEAWHDAQAALREEALAEASRRATEMEEELSPW